MLLILFTGKVVSRKISVMLLRLTTVRVKSHSVYELLPEPTQNDNIVAIKKIRVDQRLLWLPKWHTLFQIMTMTDLEGTFKGSGWECGCTLKEGVRVPWFDLPDSCFVCSYAGLNPEKDSSRRSSGSACTAAARATRSTTSDCATASSSESIAARASRTPPFTLTRSESTPRRQHHF